MSSHVGPIAPGASKRHLRDVVVRDVTAVIMR